MVESEDPPVSTGFAPVATPNARILILGSLPGVRSLQAREYYAHPQNAFWRILEAVHGIDGSYAERCEQLCEQGIALWDVLRSSVRPGSLDADIALDTASANDFEGFFARHPAIERIAFNGRKAEQLYRRFAAGSAASQGAQWFSMPSTSPAYAAMSFAKKLEIWHSMLTGGDLPTGGSGT